MTIEHQQEYALLPETRVQLQALLKQSFPGFLDDRIYYKQLPHSRLLAYEGVALVGQVGLDHRVIRMGDELCPVFGLIDLCVAPGHQRQGIGGQLLDAAARLAREAANPIDGLLLFADQHRWYQKHGFYLFERRCTWWGIDERRSLAMIERQLDACLMLKSIHRVTWPEGDIDLLGYMF